MPAQKAKAAGRYKFKGNDNDNVQGAQLKLAATKSTAKARGSG
jgi:hypothetical protein